MIQTTETLNTQTTREKIKELPYSYTVKVKDDLIHSYVAVVASSMLAALAMVCKELNIPETDVLEVSQMHRGIK